MKLDEKDELFSGNREKEGTLEGQEELSPLKRGLWAKAYKTLAVKSPQVADFYKNVYKFFKYNPEFLQIAKDRDAEKFAKMIKTRSINFIRFINGVKQVHEYWQEKQRISGRVVDQKSFGGLMHLTSGLSVSVRDVILLHGIYIWMTTGTMSLAAAGLYGGLHAVAKAGFLSFFEEIYTDYVPNRRDAQLRYNDMRDMKKQRDSSLTKIVGSSVKVFLKKKKSPEKE